MERKAEKLVVDAEEKVGSELRKIIEGANHQLRGAQKENGRPEARANAQHAEVDKERAHRVVEQATAGSRNADWAACSCAGRAGALDV